MKQRISENEVKVKFEGNLLIEHMRLLAVLWKFINSFDLDFRRKFIIKLYYSN